MRRIYIPIISNHSLESKKHFVHALNNLYLQSLWNVTHKPKMKFKVIFKTFVDITDRILVFGAHFFENRQIHFLLSRNEVYIVPVLYNTLHQRITGT